MQEQAQRKEKRLRGIAGVIAKQLKPIENNQTFIEKYSDLNLRILLNPTDSKYAAIVNLSHGRFDVEYMKNEQKEVLSKKKLKWNGMLETSTPIFLKIAMGEVSLLGQTKLIMTRKMKVKGLTKLLKFASILSLSEVVQEKPIKEKKKIRKTVKEAKTEELFSRTSKLVVAGIIGIILPVILTTLIMGALGNLTDLWSLANGDIGLMFAMILFNSLNQVSDMVLLGNGYWYVFITWAVTGLFIGLLSRDILKSLIIDGIVMGFTIIMYSIYVSIYGGILTDIPNFISTLITQSSYLYPGLIGGPEIFLSILVQVVVESFALPMLVLFTLIGGLINPRPEYYTVFDENVINLKKKGKGPGIPKKGVISSSTSVSSPSETQKEKRYLESFQTV